jgi:hypothetical protein
MKISIITFLALTTFTETLREATAHVRGGSTAIEEEEDAVATQENRMLPGRTRPRRRDPFLPTQGVFDVATINGPSSHFTPWPDNNVDFTRNPLLNAFYLNYVEGDHHVLRLGVVPTRDGVEVTHTDLQFRHDFSFYISAVQAPGGTQYETFGIQDVNAGACQVQDIPVREGFTPLLQGFLILTSGNTDHHIDRIGVRMLPPSLSPSGKPQLSVCLNDRDGSNPHGFVTTVQVAYVRSETVVSLHSTGFQYSPGSHTSYTRPEATPENARPVMTGFYADFVSGDRHLDTIGLEFVETGGSQGGILFEYADQFHGRNDPFRWIVDYAYLVPLN